MERKVLGEEHPTVAESLDNLAVVLRRAGKLAESETMHRESLARRRKLFSPDHPEVAESFRDLVLVLRAEGKLAEVETLYREELAARRKLLGNEHPDVARALHDLAVLLRDQGKLPEAEPLFREARELWRQHPDPVIERAQQAAKADPQNVHRWHDLGVSFFDSGEWQAAIAAFETCNQIGSSAWQWFFMAMAHWQLDNREEAHKWFYKSIGWMDDVQESDLRERQTEAAALLGLPDPGERSGTASNYFKQGNAYQQQEEMKKAREAYGQAIGLYESLVADFPMGRAYQMKLVDLLTKTGRQQEVEKVYRQAESVIREKLARRRKRLGNEHPDVAATLQDLAVFLRDQGKLAEAETLYREELAMRKKLFGNVHRKVEVALVALAQVLHQERKLAEAEAVGREELAMERKLSGNDHPFVANSLAELTRLLLVQEKFAEAEPLARECLTIREKKLPDDWRTFNARSLLGGSLLGQKKYTEAEPLLLSAYEGMKQREVAIPTKGKPRVKEILQRLVQLYATTGRPDQAAAWKQKLAEFQQPSP